MGRIIGTFPIGDTGESFGIAEWVPDPAVIGAELIALADELENWTEPLEESKEALHYSTELHFESESDPYGRKWAPLEIAYKEGWRKKGSNFPEAILRMSGDLYDAATLEDNWFITERAIGFNAGALPDYGPVHQTGAEKLPQRQFIGADEDTIAEIEAIFVAWLNRKTTEYIGGIGTITPVITTTGLTGSPTNIAAFGGGTSVRGAGGRFIGRTAG